MKITELKIGDVKNAGNPSEAYALLLKEKEGDRFIPVMIGWNEARTLVLAMNKVPSRRPTPHDLFVQLANHCGYSVENVLIYKFEEGIYYTYIQMKSTDENVFNLDARTSDAVTLALHYKAPIYIDTELFDEISMIEETTTEKDPIHYFESLQEEEEESTEITYTHMSNSKLQTLLEEAVENEDFEKASRIHEELERRKSKSSS